MQSPDRQSVDALDAVLPQTQCQRCGYPSCCEYARAIACGEAEINRCPPGGERTIERLSELTGRAPLTLDTQCGEEGPWRVAVIEESLCIGCTLCIQVCPVDAIVGAAKRMHTVIERECTGCELCVPVCPMDCVLLAAMPPAQTPDTPGADVAVRREASPYPAPAPADFLSAWMMTRAPSARRRFENRAERLARGPSRRLVRTKTLLRDGESRSSASTPMSNEAIASVKRCDRPLLADPGAAVNIEAAVERTRARRLASAGQAGNTPGSRRGS